MLTAHVVSLLHVELFDLQWVLVCKYRTEFLRTHIEIDTLNHSNQTNTPTKLLFFFLPRQPVIHIFSLAMAQALCLKRTVTLTVGKRVILIEVQLIERVGFDSAIYIYFLLVILWVILQVGSVHLWNQTTQTCYLSSTHFWLVAQLQICTCSSLYT